MHRRSNGSTAIVIGLAVFAMTSAHSTLAEGGAEAVFHVAPTGNDTNAGDAAAAPFATIAQAQKAVRKKIAAGLSSNVRVLIHSGTYELAQPLIFESQDSGTDRFSITYAAAPNDTVLISGGRRLLGWKQEDTGQWSVVIPEVAAGGWYFRNFFVNGRRAVRARNPNADDKVPYAKIAGVSLSTNTQSWGVALPAGQVGPWKNLSDVEIVIMQPWEITRKRLQSADPPASTVILAPPYIPNDRRIEPRAGFFYYLENARAFLDRPGEWYLDRSNGTLAYWPRPGEDLSDAETVAPTLTSLLRIQGTHSHPVRNLHFSGIHFAFADAVLPAEGYIGHGQGFSRSPEYYKNGDIRRIDDAIHWEFAASCSIEEGEIAHVGGNAVGLDKGCVQTVIRANRIFDVGDNGVILGGVAPQPANLGEQPRFNQIVNNSISACGQVYHAGVGVLLLTAKDTLVARNLVYEMPNQGIVVATSGKLTAPSIAAGYTIEDNHVHDVMKVLGDGSGIYVVGSQTNGVIRGNVVHDVTRSLVGPGPFAGIYFDDNSQGFLVESNVVYNIAGKVLQFTNSKPESHQIRDNFWYGPNRFLKRVDRYALSFAFENFLDLPHQPTFEPARLTIEARVNLTTVPAGTDPSAWIVCKNTNELTDGNYALLISRNNVGAYLNIGGGRENCHAAWSTNGPLTTNQWHLLTMTYDGADLKLYGDGRPLATTPVNSQRSPGSGPLRIGKRADGYNPSFPGLVEQIRIFNRALSPQEISNQQSVLSSQVSAVPSSQPTTDNRQLTTGLPAPVLDWNANEIYEQMQRIITNAGPREPYRSRFAKANGGQKLAPPQAESEVVPEGRAPARPPPTPVSGQKP